MSEYLIQGDSLTAIANAIRTKTGDTATMTPSEMAVAIAAISAGNDSSASTGGLPSGISALTTGTFTLSSDGTNTIYHGLGVAPTFFVIAATGDIDIAAFANYAIAGSIYNVNSITTALSNHVHVCVYSTGSRIVALTGSGSIYISNTSIDTSDFGRNFKAGVEYCWVCGVADNMT